MLFVYRGFAVNYGLTQISLFSQFSRQFQLELILESTRDVGIYVVCSLIDAEVHSKLLLYFSLETNLNRKDHLQSEYESPYYVSSEQMKCNGLCRRTFTKNRFQSIQENLSASKACSHSSIQSSSSLHYPEFTSIPHYPEK